jgi:genome maintenance exonuclease 1
MSSNRFIHENTLGDIELTTIYENGKRLYITPTNEKYPSVTTVLSGYKKEGIIQWRKRIGEEQANKISTQASRRGTKVHKLCENYLNNEDAIFESYTPDNIVMFKSIQPILDELEVVYAQERTLFSHHLKTAGRVDCVGKFRGKPHIIDFKTSNKLKKWEWIDNYFMQGAAYSVMWEEMTGIPIPNLAIIIAVADDVPQIFLENRDNWIEKFKEIRNNYDNN